jgi:hypothetical protein
LVSAVDRREEPLTKTATPDKFVSLLEQNRRIVYRSPPPTVGIRPIAKTWRRR